MGGRTTAEIVAIMRDLAECETDHEAADRLIELDARPCPYVHTADEGTSYCTLNCNHDALRPPCPTCGGKQLVDPRTTEGVGLNHCPDCVDGKASIQWMAAVFNAIEREWAILDNQDRSRYGLTDIGEGELRLLVRLRAVR